MSVAYSRFFADTARGYRDRFPEDFMFQLTAEEAERSRSQIATVKSGRDERASLEALSCANVKLVGEGKKLRPPLFDVC